MIQLPLLKRNLFFLAFLSLLWAWQILLGSAFVLDHFPPSSNLAGQVLPEWRGLLKPEWKTFIYHLVLFAAVFFQGVLWWFNRRDLDAKDLIKDLKSYVTIEMIVTFLWSSAAFKILVYPLHPELATGAFIVFFAAAMGCKVCWPYWQAWVRQMGGFYLSAARDIYWQRAALGAVVLLLFMLLYIPDIEGITARMFMGDQFHHLDTFIMGPGWALVSGQTLGVDTISRYGIGLVTVISRLAQALGGFSYEHVIQVMVGLNLIYFLAWYFLVRRWLSSTVLAAAVMLMAIKWQMFHPGASPLVFTYGEMTSARFFYDALYFWCLWMHIQSGNKNWLLGAAVSCGFGIYYQASEGIWAFASLAAYLLLLGALPVWRKYFRLHPRDILFLLLPLAMGPRIAMTEGEAAPIYQALLDHHYLELLMSFVVPAVYLLTLLVLISRLAANLSKKEDWLAVVLCFYGLGLFHGYVASPEETGYYTVCLPFVLVLGFWARVGISRLKERERTQARLALFVVAAWALVTNHMYLSYPNMLNVSPHPLTDTKVAMPMPNGEPYFNHLYRNFDPGLKLSANSLGGTQEELLVEGDFTDDQALVRYYRKNSRFTQDAALIASLTARSTEVPVISGFEIEMLMQANRKPFFYYFPLLISRPMSMRCFDACGINATDQLERTIKQFEEAKPSYVFMEKIFMVDQVPQAYLSKFPSLIPLINYVRTRYTPVAEGEYLVALKRRPGLT